MRVAVRNLPDGVLLTVADNGPGIAAEQRAAALRPFVRVGNHPPVSRAVASG